MTEATDAERAGWVREAVYRLMEAGKLSCWMDVNEHIEAYHTIFAALSPPAAPAEGAVKVRARKIIRATTMVDLLADIYAAEGWKRAEGESRTKRVQEVYAITSEPQRNRYVATPLSALTAAPAPAVDSGVAGEPVPQYRWRPKDCINAEWSIWFEGPIPVNDWIETETRTLYHPPALSRDPGGF